MTFEGFAQPQSNYSKLPHEFILLLPDFSCHAELCVVIYTLRHTWGFGEYGQLKKITLDEYENGRRRADGSRMDRGCGVKASAVRRGLSRAVEHGFLIHEQDASDPGRVENYYGLNIKPVIQGDQFEYPGVQYEHPTDQFEYPRPVTGDQNDHSGRSDRSPVQREIPLKKTKDQKATEKKERVSGSIDTSHTLQIGKPLQDRMRSTKNRRLSHSKPAARPSASPPVPARPLSNRSEKGRGIHEHPLWIAFRDRWFELTSTKLPVPKHLERAYLNAALEMDGMGVKPDHLRRLAEDWITKEHFDYPFSWTVDRIHVVLSAEGVKRSSPYDPDNSDDLSTIDACQRVLEDPFASTLRRRLAQEQLERLNADADMAPPDDFWPERKEDQTIGAYFTYRRELWASIRVSGYGDDYMRSAEPAWLGSGET